MSALAEQDTPPHGYLVEEQATPPSGYRVTEQTTPASGYRVVQQATPPSGYRLVPQATPPAAHQVTPQATPPAAHQVTPQAIPPAAHQVTPQAAPAGHCVAEQATPARGLPVATETAATSPKGYHYLAPQTTPPKEYRLADLTPAIGMRAVDEVTPDGGVQGIGSAAPESTVPAPTPPRPTKPKRAPFPGLVGVWRLMPRMRPAVVGLVAACLILAGTGIVVVARSASTDRHPNANMPATSAPVVVVAPVEPPPDCAVLACVALTFDDGPGPYTSALLDVLDDKQAKATFFVLGSNVTRNRELVARAAASGHVIGNHSWSHKNLVKTDSGTITVELESTSTEVFDITGAYPDLMRPPYGTVNDAVVSAASVHDIALVLWDIDTEDWKNRDPQVTTARALEATSGSIILMHDIHESTLIAVPGIIDGLRAAGYTLVTVPDLLGSVHPGQVYWNRSDEVGSTEAHPYDPSDNQICWAPEPVSTPPESRPEP